MEEEKKAVPVPMVKAPFSPEQIKTLLFLQSQHYIKPFYCSKETVQTSPNIVAQLDGWSAILHEGKPVLRSVTMFGLVCPVCGDTVSEIPAHMLDVRNIKRVYGELRKMEKAGSPIAFWCEDGEAEYGVTFVTFVTFLHTGESFVSLATEYYEFKRRLWTGPEDEIKTAAEIAMEKADRIDAANKAQTATESQQEGKEGDSAGGRVGASWLLSPEVYAFALLIEDRLLARENDAAGRGEPWGEKRPWMDGKASSVDIIQAAKADNKDMGEIIEQIARLQSRGKLDDAMLNAQGTVMAAETAVSLMALFDMLSGFRGDQVYKGVVDSVVKQTIVKHERLSKGQASPEAYMDYVRQVVARGRISAIKAIKEDRKLSLPSAKEEWAADKKAAFEKDPKAFQREYEGQYETAMPASRDGVPEVQNWVSSVRAMAQKGDLLEACSSLVLGYLGRYTMPVDSTQGENQRAITAWKDFRITLADKTVQGMGTTSAEALRLLGIWFKVQYGELTEDYVLTPEFDTTKRNEKRQAWERLTRQIEAKGMPKNAAYVSAFKSLK
jgi:hypothetical protein